MNVRVAHLRIKPGFGDAFKRVYSVELLPIMQAQSGFIFSYLYQDTEDGTDCLSVIGWQNRSDFDSFRGSSSHKEYIEKVRHFIDTSATRKSYEMITGGENT
jgi:heme-degrading monooxygenase HmoA